jgi:hypothetical protein
VPTYEWQDRFSLDLKKLDPAQQVAFRASVRKFVADLERGDFRKGLRVKTVQGAAGVWEMTWADDGRATFSYGPEQRPGQKHIIWRRIGTHASVFHAP